MLLVCFRGVIGTWSVLLYHVKILHTWNALFFFAEILLITVLSHYLNAFLHSSKVTVKAAVLDDLLYSEMLFLSPAEIVDN